MGKDTKINYSKNFKKIIISSVFCFGILVIFALGLFLYKLDYSMMCIVKYIHWNDEVEVHRYHKGEKINLPEPDMKLGYDFVGWSLNNNDEILSSEICVEGELTLYARWEEKSFTLVYGDREYVLTYSDKVCVDKDKITIAKDNNEFEILAPSISGKNFIKWCVFDGKGNCDLEGYTFINKKISKFELIPVYDENLYTFYIENSDNFKIKNLSHNDYIADGETLTFSIELNSNVNQSKITISSTSGILSYTNYNGEYFVSISGFDKDFDIVIENISINKYRVDFVDDEDKYSYDIIHGDKIVFPELVKLGYKLIGFKDSDGRFYTDEYLITSNLILYTVWHQEEYEISFPKTNGTYFITVNDQIVNSSKKLLMRYGDEILFKIVLSSAYDKSNYTVVAETDFGELNAVCLSKDTYKFTNVNCDMEIVVEGVTLNSYKVCVDGTAYGNFSYGSWITIEESGIVITDSYNNKMIRVNTMIRDDNFSGWKTNEEVLTNCMVQDIADNSNTIEVYGNYSKKIARVQLVSNGGVLPITEIILVEGEALNLPEPVKGGYKFAGWYTKLVEVNTLVDEQLSVKFDGVTDFNMVLYAGWTK